MPPAAGKPRLTVDQRSRIVKIFYESGKNARHTVRIFKSDYPMYKTLSHTTVLALVAKFENNGTVEDLAKKHSGRKKTVRIPATINTVQQQVQVNPQASIRRIVAQTGLKRSSVHQIIKKDLKLKPYRPHLVQALNAADPAKRVKWAEDFLKAVDMDLTYPDYILWSDEAIFHLDGTVNRFNSVTWATQNPHVYVEKATQNKAGVMLWVGLIKDHIIGPFFFDGSVNGDIYLQLLQTQVLPELRAVMGEDEEFVIFQQDGASAHYSTKVRDWLNAKFEDRWMGRLGPIAWPARSPDLTPLDFWLWGYLKNRVYGQNVSKLQQLRVAIEGEIEAIPPSMVHNATLSVVAIAKELISINGLQLGIFK